MPENAHREHRSLEEGTSTPVSQSVPVKISSRNAIKQPFVEHTTTLQISCHGCRFRSRQFVLKGTEVILELPSVGRSIERQLITSTVISSRKPDARGEPFEVDVAFEIPANVWGLAFPPEDWRPFTNRGSCQEVIPLKARASEKEIRMNEAQGQTFEASRVVPITPAAERFERTPEPLQEGPQGIEEVSARLAMLEKQIAGISETLAQMHSAQEKASQMGVCRPEASSEAPLRRTREVETAFNVMEQKVDSKLELLRAAEERLGALQKQFDEGLHGATEQARQATDQCMGGVASELAEFASRTKKDLLETASSTIQEHVEKLKAEGAQVTQTTFDSLHQAAEWCTGKAQTGMQGHLDAALAQAAESLRDKAAGACQLFATELDHYSQNFVAHTKKLVGECTTERIEDARNQLKLEQAELGASFGTNLRHFADEFRIQLEKMNDVNLDEVRVRLSELMGEQDSQFQINAAQAVAGFQEQLAHCTSAAAEEAARSLESRFAAVMEVMRKETESQKAAWNERRVKELDESITQFRQSLEGASNTSRAATIALLMQDSQKLKDRLAAGLMYGLQQSAVKGCVDLAKILSQKSITPVRSPEPAPAEDKKNK